MKFGPVATADATGTILAHSLTTAEIRFKKGRRLSAADVRALAAAGIQEVTVARLSDEDVFEDDAAQRLAARLAAPGLSASAPFTGRANLHAEAPGLLTVNAAAVASLNAAHEAITLATLPPFARVQARQMVATIKIIPYAAPAEALARAEAALAANTLTLHPFELKTARLILTTTQGLKPSLLAKAEGSLAQRLTSLGMRLSAPQTVPHTAQAVAEALATPSDAELTLIFGASATSDRADACPAGLIAAGGALTRFGMPVDPGNLLFLGEHRARPVIGLPGCARSPALNGADWVLERIVAGLDVTAADIADMGVGGLLKEIPSRPRPRAAAPKPPGRPNVHLLLLAAGSSSRMQGRDKLLEEIDGEPLLTRSARRLAGALADGTTAVLAPDHPARAAALSSLGIATVIAPDAASGMAASLRAGLAAVPQEADAVIVALADMPDVTADHVNRLIAAFDPAEGREIARAMDETGQPGHPVLFARRFFESLAGLSGDTGAKSVLTEGRDFLVDVPTPGLGATTDLDTPQAWAAWRSARG